MIRDVFGTIYLTILYTQSHFEQASSYVDLSSPSLFQDQVHIASNYSNGIAVREDTELLPIISAVTAIVVHDVFNNGAVKNFVVKEVLEPLAEKACGEFMAILENAIAVIFEEVGKAIYDALALDILDQAVIQIINGGTANMMDVIMNLLGDVFGVLKTLFQSLKTKIDIIKGGLELFGALDCINKIFKGFTMISDEPQEEEFIKITDGNGNNGYLSSDEHNLITSSGGLEDLVNFLKSNTIQHIRILQEQITSLRDSLDSNTPSTAMNSIMTNIGLIINNAKDAFHSFLGKTESLGSIQFLISAELAGVVGICFEAGISIDVKHILYYLSNNFNWDPTFTSLASFHVSYAIDAGVQVGGDVGFSIVYHTSRVTGVRPITTVRFSSYSHLNTV